MSNSGKPPVYEAPVLNGEPENFDDNNKGVLSTPMAEGFVDVDAALQKKALIFEDKEQAEQAQLNDFPDDLNRGNQCLQPEAALTDSICILENGGEELKEIRENYAIDIENTRIHEGILRSSVLITSLAYQDNDKQALEFIEMGENGEPKPLAPIIPILDEDGDIQSYQTFQLETDNSAFVPWVLLPAEEINSVKNTIDIHVTCRGTNSFKGAIRDISEVHGAGNKTNVASSPKVLEQLNKIINQFSSRPDVIEAIRLRKKINLIFSGHSLGGADAQMILVQFLEDLMTKDTNFALKDLIPNLSIRLFVRNSAGITNKFADRADHVLNSNYFKNINFQIYFMVNNGDLIQQTGQADLLHVFNKYNSNALAVYVKFLCEDDFNEQDWGARFKHTLSKIKFEQHTDKPILNRSIFELPHLIITNQTESGRAEIESRMQHAPWMDKTQALFLGEDQEEQISDNASSDEDSSGCEKIKFLSDEEGTRNNVASLLEEIPPNFRVPIAKNDYIDSERKERYEEISITASESFALKTGVSEANTQKFYDGKNIKQATIGNEALTENHAKIEIYDFYIDDSNRIYQNDNGSKLEQIESEHNGKTSSNSTKTPQVDIYFDQNNDVSVADNQEPIVVAGIKNHEEDHNLVPDDTRLILGITPKLELEKSVETIKSKSPESSKSEHNGEEFECVQIINGSTCPDQNEPKTPWQSIKASLSNGWNTIKTGLSSICRTVKNFFAGCFTAVGDLFRSQPKDDDADIRYTDDQVNGLNPDDHHGHFYKDEDNNKVEVNMLNKENEQSSDFESKPESEEPKSKKSKRFLPAFVAAGVGFAALAVVAMNRSSGSGPTKPPVTIRR